MATLEETLRKLGLATARGVPQLATGFVDLAALPFTTTGMMRPEQVFGSTDYLTAKGLLPPPQQGLLGETTELVSSALSPAGAAKTIGLLGATKASKEAMDAIRKMSAERVPTDLSWANNPMTAEPPRITNALPLEDIVKNAENANVKLDISNKNGVLNISKIVVPKEQRGSGVGSSIMRQLSDYADATGTRLTLSPSVDFGATSVSRLKDFYKQFGFIENKGRNKDFSTRETMYREAQNQGSIKPTGLLGSPKSLTMPDVPTVDQMKQYGRVETVPLSKAVSFQSARNWEKFNAGKSPGDLVAGYGDKPLALRLETGEYVIYDGNHRTDLALQKGKTELPMHVIDVKSYDPAHAGRKPVPDKISSDELLKLLLGN